MLVSHKHKLVIFTLERTASQSIHSGISNLFDVCIDGRKYRHINASEFAHYIEPFLSTKYYKISIFREPISWCISGYSKIISHPFERKISFNKWLSLDPNWISQYNRLSYNKQFYIDQVFDFNKLNLFTDFISSVFNTKILLPHFGKTEQKNVAPTLSDLEYIHSHLDKDINFYKSIVDAGGKLIINPYQSTI